MTKYFADTNVFLRYLLDDIPVQADETQKNLERAKNREIEIIVPQIVIFEIEFSLRRTYGFSREQVVKHLGAIVNMPYIEVEDQKIFQEALLLYLKNNLDLVDCFLLTKANQEGGKVLSFDRKVKRH